MRLAGEDVTLVDRWAAHVEAIRRDGLFIDGLRGEHRVAIDVMTPDELAAPAVSPEPPAREKATYARRRSPGGSAAAPFCSR